MKQFSQTWSASVLAGIATIPALAMCFTGCGVKPERPKGDAASLPTVPVHVQTVESKPQAITEEVVGTIRAKLFATLEAKVSGRIDKLPVVLGQRVKAGDLVAHLDASEISARWEQANAALEEAERDWKRASALF